MLFSINISQHADGRTTRACGREKKGIRPRRALQPTCPAYARIELEPVQERHVEACLGPPAVGMGVVVECPSVAVPRLVKLTGVAARPSTPRCLVLGRAERLGSPCRRAAARAGDQHVPGSAFRVRKGSGRELGQRARGDAPSQQRQERRLHGSGTRPKADVRICCGLTSFEVLSWAARREGDDVRGTVLVGGRIMDPEIALISRLANLLSDG